MKGKQSFFNFIYFIYFIATKINISTPKITILTPNLQLISPGYSDNYDTAYMCSGKGG